MRRPLLALVAVAVITLSAVGALGAAPASAADIGPSLTNVSSSLVSGPASTTEGSATQYQLSFDACVPSGTSGGDSWTVQLPTALTDWPTGFTISNPADASQAWIDVAISNGVATFTLTGAGAAQSDLCFTSQFGGRLSSTASTGQQTLTFTVNGGVTTTASTITVTPGTGSYPFTNFGKGMSFASGDQCRTITQDCLTAAFVIAAGDHGVVTITDQAQGNWTFDCSRAPNPAQGNYDGQGGVTYTYPTNLLHVVGCTPQALTFTLDTTGQSQLTSWVVYVPLSATAPGGSGLITYDNTATVTSTSGTDTSVSGQTQSTYAGGSATGAGIVLKKTDSAGDHAPDASAPITLPSGTTGLVFTVFNNGTQPLADITVSDAVVAGSGTVSGLSCAFPDGSSGTSWAGPLQPNQSFSCTATLSGVVGAHEDTATVIGTGTGGIPVTASDSYNAFTPAPGIGIAKTATPTTVAKAGDKVDYTFTVTNTGNVTLNDVSVDDTTFSGTGTLSAIDCPSTSLAPGASENCTASYDVTQADVDAGTLTNTATATGTPTGSTTPITSTPSTATVTATQSPAVSLVKTASTTTVTEAGQSVSYTFKITNTGNTDLSKITPNETGFTGTGTLSAIDCPSTSLAPGESEDCTATYAVTDADLSAGEIDNTATATGTPPTGSPVTSAPSTVVIDTVKPVAPAASSGPTASVAGPAVDTGGTMAASDHDAATLWLLIGIGICLTTMLGAIGYRRRRDGSA